VVRHEVVVEVAVVVGIPGEEYLAAAAAAEEAAEAAVNIPVEEETRDLVVAAAAVVVVEEGHFHRDYSYSSEQAHPTIGIPKEEGEKSDHYRLVVVAAAPAVVVEASLPGEEEETLRHPK
jgi:hypothetical protein